MFVMSRIHSVRRQTVVSRASLTKGTSQLPRLLTSVNYLLLTLLLISTDATTISFTTEGVFSISAHICVSRELISLMEASDQVAHRMLRERNVQRVNHGRSSQTLLEVSCLIITLSHVRPVHNEDQRKSLCDLHIFTVTKHVPGVVVDAAGVVVVAAGVVVVAAGVVVVAAGVVVVAAGVVVVAAGVVVVAAVW